MTTHSLSTNRQCPFYGGKDPLYKIAGQTPSFQAVDVIGPDVCHDEGASFHRHLLPGMEKECTGCGAKMWLNEKLSSSSLRYPKFGLCCGSGKVSLPLPTPPPEPMLSLLICHNSSNQTSQILICLHRQPPFPILPKSVPILPKSPTKVDFSI
ncbi:hypothetical protein [Absidia glauca]|uniref:Uncharacterized protein n=1 Tax=Absidia glauca TaxID=4829 RepID=A0A168PTQ6_ABSGL|nr:hypothetical protein [Absidia glauca]